MSYYSVPKINVKIQAKDFKLKFNKISKIQPIISTTISSYLNKIKHKINEHSKDWDNVKKITNSYEYIHTNLSNSKHAISKIKPLSRSFFKLIEMYNTFELFTNSPTSAIKSFHLAEGPGGFIEAMTYLRFNKNDRYYGMTLVDNTNDNIPGWKKSSLFIKKNPNVVIETGVNGTGNLYLPENYLYCKEKYSGTMNLITADGGFDFSTDFNRQENQAFRLIFTEVMYALTMQKKEGNFILKVFDIFSKGTIDLIYLLSTFYETVYITKPRTSRTANSEKYIICKHFNGGINKQISDKFFKILLIHNNPTMNDFIIESIIDIPYQYKFRQAIEEINAIIVTQQINNIILTLRLIENKERKSERIRQIKNANIQKCINWCEKNKIPYYKTYQQGNTFLSKTANCKLTFQ